MRLAIAFTALVVILSTPPALRAGEIDADLRLGVYTDASEGFLGGGILTRFGSSRWLFNPNLEYVFVERGDLATLNADFHYDLTSMGETDFWLGAGPALVFRDNDRGSDDTDLGVNLFAGVGFLRNQAIRPFFQVKLLIYDETEGVLAFGIRFL